MGNDGIDIYEFAYKLSYKKDKRKLFVIGLGIIYSFDLIFFLILKNVIKINSIISFLIIFVSICTYPFLIGIIRSFFPFHERKIENKKLGESSKAIEDAIKNYFNESFVDQNDIVCRAKQASAYLINTGIIISDLQKEMEERNRALESLLSTIETRKQDAEYYAQLAALNEQLAAPLMKEIEKVIRNEFELKEKQKRVFNILIWIVTLIAGGIVGVLFQIWFS